MKKHALLISLAAMLCISLPIAQAASPDLVQEARALNQQSKKHLGVSVRALLLLFDAQPGTFSLKYGLLHDGSWPYLGELQRAGLVVVTTKSGKPYTTVPPNTWLSIKLTNKGQQVRDGLVEH